MGRKFLICLIILSWVLFPDRGETAPNVVVGIKPIHSLVAAVMENVGTPRLLIRGGASPHSYSLKPSDKFSIVTMKTDNSLKVYNLFFMAG